MGTKGNKSVRKSAAKASKELMASLAGIWPEERDVMMRPDRLKYVRKMVKPKGCVFCSAAKRGPGFESLCLHRGQRAMVMLNKYPYNNGHILILPVRHVGDFMGLKENEHHDVHALLRETISILGKVYGPGGFNVGLNLGAAAGAGIPDHLHYHVVPRWWGDTNFFPLLADTKVVVETLEQTYTRLLPYFEKLRTSKAAK